MTGHMRLMGQGCLVAPCMKPCFGSQYTNTHICQCGEATCVSVHAYVRACVHACVRACVRVCVCVHCKMTAHINHQTAQQYKGATVFQDRQMGHSQPQQSSTCLVCSGSISM